jgi:predicted nucleotide-binding protein
MEWRLTLDGMALASEGDDELRLFLAALAYAADKEKRQTDAGNDGDCPVAVEELAQHCPQIPDISSAARAAEMLTQAWDVSSGATASAPEMPGRWSSVHISKPGVRKYRGVTSWNGFTTVRDAPKAAMMQENDVMPKTAPSAPDPRKVFVIHGRNEPARRGLFEFLRAIGLDPIEWSQAIAMTGAGSPYIGQVLDAALAAAQAIVVLQTPDDVAYLHPSLAAPDDPECQPMTQARPNVLFEAGMAIGRAEDRTVIVEMGKVRAFSDIHGRHVVRMDGSMAMRQELANRLKTIGCDVNTSGHDWHLAGDLTPPAEGGLPLGRRLPSTEARVTPQLDARLLSGSGSSGHVHITNHGPGEVYELNVDADPSTDLLVHAADLPVAKLPVGKSIKLIRAAHSGSKSYFTFKVTGKTVDGVDFEQELFVS